MVFFQNGVFKKPFKVSIIGGAGRMGQLFFQKFFDCGADVYLIDRHEKNEIKNFFKKPSNQYLFNQANFEKNYFSMQDDNSKKCIASSDIVLFSASLMKMSEAIEMFAPHVSDGKLIIDIASIKQTIAKDFLQNTRPNVSLILCHPMFGAYPSIKGETMVVCSVRPGHWLDGIVDFFRFLGLNLALTDVESHDKNTSITQSLLHAMFVLLYGSD